MANPIPKAKLIVDASGRGVFTVNGLELPVSHVAVEAIAGRGSWVRFEMLANIECELAPGGVQLSIREESGGR